MITRHLNFKSGALLYCIGILRLVLSVYFIIASTLFYDTNIASFNYVLIICSIIAFSDVIDGNIARTIWQNQVEKVKKYRCFDGVIDKVSMLIAVVGLMYTGKLSIFMFTFLAARELVVLLLGFGAYYGNKRECIIGTCSGRLYYIMLMIFALLLYPNNSVINAVNIINVNNTFLIILTIIAVCNFAEHVKNAIFIGKIVKITDYN